MDFLQFLDSAVTPYHTVFQLKSAFLGAGYAQNEIFERNGALVVVRRPRNISEKSRFRIALAHTDFPALKVAPNPDKVCAGVNKLHVETYGGLLYTSWLDRDLGYAGMLAFEREGLVQTRLVRGNKLFRIPQLAIHLNRGVNQDGLKVNPQTDLDVLWSSAMAGTDKLSNGFLDVLRGELGAGERLLDFDVQLFDVQGSYPDMDQIPEGYEALMGFGLEYALIDPIDGMLDPMGPMTRAQLANLIMMFAAE